MNRVWVTPSKRLTRPITIWNGKRNNETDGKKADGVIYVGGEIIGVVELKDQKSKNLDAVEAQAFNYHASHSNSKYIIISNFDELRFYIDKKTAYEKFSLFNLTYEDFKTLHLLLSFESIRDNVPIKLKEKSSTFEQSISKELYRDFSAFRAHLFENIVHNNPDTDKQSLLRLTQKLCDRIVFILFAEDRGLLRPNMIREIRSRHENDVFGNPMYEFYKIYFRAINEGNAKLDIPRYNGGLFAHDPLLDSLIIDDEYLDMEAQKLSDFDFVSDISVNILGHIFEQSLTDLEEMNAQVHDEAFDRKKSKRKKDGVFYTPEYITRYIVENTLGKLCAEKKTALNLSELEMPDNPKKLTKSEKETLANLYAYRDWLLNLKILDPACGSGAFLNQALEFLIREHRNIDEYRRAYENEALSLYDIETNILEHNLYGVDINEDAVEIARLSLWLRTAQKGRALTNLSDKIKCGNSLIADKSVAENAFVWEEEFPDVFAHGGFDVVIGNPPYGAELSEEHKKYFNYHFKNIEYQLDTYLLFIEKSINLLKKDSFIGFIMPNTWMSSLFAKKIRSFITYNVTIPEITHYDYFVFEDATVEADTYFFKKTQPLNNEITIKIKTKSSEKSHILNQEIWQKNGDPINIYETMKLQVIKSKILDSALMGEITQIVQETKPFQVNKGVPKQTKEILEEKPFISEIKKDDTFLPLLRGSLIERYQIHWSQNYWISYGEWLAEQRLSAKFDCEEKLVIRQTSDSLIATYDNQQFIARDNLYVIRNDEKNINLKYLLALINSKLLTWFYRNIINPEEGKALAQVKRGHLQNLPIKRSSLDKEMGFVILVDEILESKPKIKEYKTLLDEAIKNDNFDREIKLKKEIEMMENRVIECENEIDSMVYALYGLSEDEIAIVEGK